MRRRIVGLAALLMALLLCGGALAAQFDIDRQGSIALLIHTGDDGRVQGAQMELYRVGDAVVQDSALTFVLTEEFVGSGADITQINAPATAQTLAKAADGAVPTATAVTGEDGRATFEELGVGLYLVRQNGFAQEPCFSQIEPFIVSVPMTNEQGDGWNYAVKAAPKVNALPRPTATPRPTSAPTDDRLPQTGMLRWPVPVLGVGGLVLFGLGWTLCFMRKKSGDGDA